MEALRLGSAAGSLASSEQQEACVRSAMIVQILSSRSWRFASAIGEVKMTKGSGQEVDGKHIS